MNFLAKLNFLPFFGLRNVQLHVKKIFYAKTSEASKSSVATHRTQGSFVGRLFAKKTAVDPGSMKESLEFSFDTSGCLAVS